MQQPIMTSVAFLSQASAPADPSNDEDRATATDLRDTLAAHRGECVGMAANMIGVAKRIIVFQDKENNRNAIMFNPRIIAGSDPFDTVEGCLSLDGERPTTRTRASPSPIRLAAGANTRLPSTDSPRKSSNTKSITSTASSSDE